MSRCDLVFLFGLSAFFGINAAISLFEGGDHAMRRALGCLAMPAMFIGLFVVYDWLPRRSFAEARSLLAHYPGPVRISLSQERRLRGPILILALAGLTALAPARGKPYEDLVRICAVAFLLLGALLVVNAMARGSSLTLTGAGFETAFGLRVKSWKWREIGAPSGP